ncbi:MAG: hypothetical protein FD165_2624 [Gammaproteobacteria bacterium]|nr:MAG: hypothetical protein FD165_2624 [Gammaproteobacteria bacterium]TND01597.1 MAG: hypothetical protein FD120_2545 [Gammaproteobacteria bacterium]
MPAYNARLRPKELFGLPLWGVISGLVALVCGFMALVLPWLSLKVLLGLAGMGFFIGMTAIFALGDDVAFLSVRLRATRERNGRPAEVNTRA